MATSRSSRKTISKIEKGIRKYFEDNDPLIPKKYQVHPDIRREIIKEISKDIKKYIEAEEEE